ncbi:MAG: transposase [Mucilaginibacter sp.]|uniref:IS1 family transposase n=1 Tax=Mucilaginibacter sp. TaxID=1882438 RepID=UPI0026123CCA|nr:IS1 family transposase [Mucilaginibacter sp.]MDB5002081.1 transposase [Mucilaginibacter sp.]
MPKMLAEFLEYLETKECNHPHDVHLPCIKIVVVINCPYCQGMPIKFGKTGTRQRYRCIACKRVFMNTYINKACCASINNHIVNFLKEGCGIRSIARLLSISINTVISRIKSIANSVIRPIIANGRIYEMDELRTYIKNKDNDCWVIYALDKQTGQVVDMKVGKRNKMNLKRITDTLLLAKCNQVYTDGLTIYKHLLPYAIHKVRRYGTNRIERKNLSLRTHLKRLNRKTICYSKSATMLEACLKIYFWLPGQPM